DADRRRTGRRRGRSALSGMARVAAPGGRRPADDWLTLGHSMRVPFTYVVRNLFARRLTTALTAAGMALVVYVFATVLMLSAGLRATLVATGQDDNVVVIRSGSQTEVQSGIDRTQAGVVETLADIAAGQDGLPLISKEPVVLINLPKRESGKPSNVVIRGVTSRGLALRPRVRIVDGRMCQPGTA